jgi:uncharacterized repeat protein (TIGR01451 family)
MRARRSVIVLGLALGATVTSAGWTGPASAADLQPSHLETVASPPGVVGTESGPQLSIAIDDGHTSTAAGDSLTYAIVVKNLSSSAADGLHVTQTMPAGLTYVSADAGGALQGDKVSWNLTIGGSGEATLHTTASLGSTPSEVLRLAPVACASASVDGPPIVCASHSDQLPAGAAADSAKQAAPAAAESASSRPGWVFGITALLVIVAIAALGAAVVRRRRSEPSSPTS